jgi:hypothetical protein
MKNIFKHLNYIIIIFFACSNNNIINKGNCSGAQEFFDKNYVQSTTIGGIISIAIVGCDENSDGSFTITYINIPTPITGANENLGMPVKQYCKVGFDGNKYSIK